MACSKEYVDVMKCLVQSQKIYQELHGNYIDQLWDRLEEVMNPRKDGAFLDLNVLIGQINFECNDKGEHISETFSKTVIEKLEELGIEYNSIKINQSLVIPRMLPINEKTMEAYEELFLTIREQVSKIVQLPFGYKKVILQCGELTYQIPEEYPTIEAIWDYFAEIEQEEGFSSLGFKEQTEETITILFYPK